MGYPHTNSLSRVLTKIHPQTQVLPDYVIGMQLKRVVEE